MHRIGLDKRISLPACQAVGNNELLGYPAYLRRVLKAYDVSGIYQTGTNVLWMQPCYRYPTSPRFMNG